MTVQFSLGSNAPETTATPVAVVGVYENGVLTSAAARIDTAAQGAIKRLVEAGDVTGKVGNVVTLLQPAGIAAARVLILGLGAQKTFDAARYQRVTLEAARAIGRLPVAEAVSWLPEIDVPGRDAAWRVRVAALATDHAAYRYTATVKPRDKAQPELTSLVLVGPAEGESGLAEARAIAEGVRYARELGNLPPNICNPDYIADQARAFAEANDGVTFEALDRADMEREGFGSLLAVARGSANAPRLVILQWNGGAEGDRPYAFVGKGITFDTGGVSLKPGPGMEEMKFDMCGAAGVLGAFVAAVKLKLPVNLVCVVPAVENMPDGAAYRPGDVLTSLSGITIEVLNTDAEGRLILCDALTYTGKRFDPHTIIDAATLTGACVVALGKHASGLMTKDESLSAELLAAGEATLDRAWRLPLWDDYQSQLDSGFADVANIGGKYAGAITAGCFLARFTEGRRWAHLDIAGTAWDEGRKGLATGRPVPLLTQWLLDRVAAADRVSMPRADFYLIDKPRFREDPLLLVCELAKRAFAAQQPTLILTRDFEQAEAIDEYLWSFDEDSFIPHQLAGDDDDGDTAILIVPPGVDTADRPMVINLRDVCAPGHFDRVLEVVAADPAEREGSRTRWTQYKKGGFEVNKHDM